MVLVRYLQDLRSDFRFAVRQLLAHPGFASLAVVTLALGIGATTAIFSAVHAVVLDPLPLPEPDRIVAVYEELRGRPGNVSAGNFVDAQGRSSSFDAMTAIQYSSFNLAVSGTAERVIGARATAGFFTVFGVQPSIGRAFTDLDDQPGHEQSSSSVIVSGRGGSRPTRRSSAATYGWVAGRTGVIGVMPASFDLNADSEELWVPAAFTSERKATHDEHYLAVYGRLKRGITQQQAHADLRRIAQQLRVQFPKDDQELAFRIVPLMQDFVGDYSTRLYILFGAVVVVLLIACTNVANLLLARGAARAGEIAVRSALGASRGRLFRQLLAESLVIAGVAAAAGLAIASWGIHALVSLSPPGIPRLEQTRLDGPVLLFALGAAILSAVVSGAAPALRAVRGDLQAVLKEGGRSAAMGGVKDRLRTALIAGELALALLLLTGASLLIQSAIALQRVPPGFDPEGVVSARLSLPAETYDSPARVEQTFERIVADASAIPGVKIVAVTSQVPRAPGGSGNGLLPEGKAPESQNFILSRLRMVTPAYFEAMRIPIARGRALTDSDRRGALKVMVISEALARAAFGDADPIGKRISCCEGGPERRSGLQDGRRCRRRCAVQRSRRAAVAGVLSADRSSAPRGVDLDPADHVRRHSCVGRLRRWRRVLARRGAARCT